MHAKNPWLPEVANRQNELGDYTPFGLNLVGIETQGQPNHKYQYNGKEKQTELGLNWIDYGARMYDAQLGRFHTQDRFAEKYYDFNPYQYGANNPIKFIDVNGDSLSITHNTGFLGLGKKETVRYEGGSLYNKDGSDYTGKVKGFLKTTVNTLNEIRSGKEGGSLLNEVESSAETITIVNNATKGNEYDSGTNTLKFDPQSTEGGLNTMGDRSRPAFIGLGHEMSHGLDDLRGTLNTVTIPGQTFTFAEHFATDIENKLRAEHFLPLRQYYGVNALGAGNYPLLNAAGQSLHNGGYDYKGAMKIEPRRVLIPGAMVPAVNKKID